MTTFWKYKVKKETLTPEQQKRMGRRVWVYSRLSPQEWAGFYMSDCELPDRSMQPLLQEQLEMETGKKVSLNSDDI